MGNSVLDQAVKRRRARQSSFYGRGLTKVPFGLVGPDGMAQAQ